MRAKGFTRVPFLDDGEGFHAELQCCRTWQNQDSSERGDLKITPHRTIQRT